MSRGQDKVQGQLKRSWTPSAVAQLLGYAIPLTMSHTKCSIRFNLEHWRDAVIHYYLLRGSAGTCKYCKILFDGVNGLGFEQDHKSFSFGVYSTLKLTVQDLLGASGIQQSIEFY